MSNETLAVESPAPSALKSFHRYAAVLLLGFASGLPLALVGSTMQAWLVADGVTIATIGFFGLVGVPYTFKFIWAPLMDRFELPLFGRRRGWVIMSQLAIAGALWWMSTIAPRGNAQVFALIAVLVAFLSASQDVVIDAYRTDLLMPRERGMGASLAVFGYRLAMVLSGGIAFIWADQKTGLGWSWSYIYQIMAMIMVGAAAVSLLLLPKLPGHLKAPKTQASRDLIGFVALVLAVGIGYQITYMLVQPGLDNLFQVATVATNKKWSDLAALLCGIGITLPLAWWASKLTQFETLNRSMKSYFSQHRAATFLLLIILYKLGDAFAGALLTPFLLKVVGFAPAEVGVVNKVLGIWLTIGGALLGGALMIRIGLYRALLWFGALQVLSNLGFWMVAVSTKGAWGGFDLPAFNWWIVMLKETTHIDYQLITVIALENITGGMGTAALVALLMALCNQRFTATQYALLSALSAVGRVWVAPFSGVLTEAMGWPAFYIFSIVMGIPGIWMLVHLKKDVLALEAPPVALDLED
jgi:MFS transporter, PAT family, beta-lactamase induction signal transducer AmpG